MLNRILCSCHTIAITLTAASLAVACGGAPRAETTTPAAAPGTTSTAATTPASAQAAPRVLINRADTGVALGGYDPVGYFSDNRPIQGKSDFQSQHGGAVYYFASAEHKAMFDKEPARYVPQYGGFCGYAASINKISPIDPQVFQITDGRLILHHSREAYDLFNADTPASVTRADTNWPGLVSQYGK